MAQLGAEARVGAQRRGRAGEHAEEVRQLAARGHRPLEDGQRALGRGEVVVDVEPAHLRLHGEPLGAVGRIALLTLRKCRTTLGFLQAAQGRSARPRSGARRRCSERARRRAVEMAMRISSRPRANAQAMIRSGRGPTHSAGVRAGRRRSAGASERGRGAPSGRPVITFVRRPSGARPRRPGTPSHWRRSVLAALHAAGSHGESAAGAARARGARPARLPGRRRSGPRRRRGRGARRARAWPPRRCAAAALGALALAVAGRASRAALVGRLDQRERGPEAGRRSVVDRARAGHAREEVVPAPVGDRPRSAGRTAPLANGWRVLA